MIQQVKVRFNWNTPPCGGAKVQRTEVTDGSAPKFKNMAGSNLSGAPAVIRDLQSGQKLVKISI